MSADTEKDKLHKSIYIFPRENHVNCSFVFQRPVNALACPLLWSSDSGRLHPWLTSVVWSAGGKLLSSAVEFKTLRHLSVSENLLFCVT